MTLFYSLTNWYILVSYFVFTYYYLFFVFVIISHSVVWLKGIVSINVSTTCTLVLVLCLTVNRMLVLLFWSIFISPKFNNYQSPTTTNLAMWLHNSDQDSILKTWLTFLEIRMLVTWFQNPVSQISSFESQRVMSREDHTMLLLYLLKPDMRYNWVMMMVI